MHDERSDSEECMAEEPEVVMPLQEVVLHSEW
jgi:hypothetical protein